MDELRIDRRTIGVNFNNNAEAEILLWAPLAASAAVFLVETETCINLDKGQYGYWQTITHQLKKDDLYKFRVDGKMLPDPASLAQPEGVHGPSKAINLAEFHWEDDTWGNFDLESYIIYELHTGTFSGYGNFAGIEEKLDYLKDLGITAIEIMPVAQFSGERNWGYDGVFPFSVQPSYGGGDGLQRLVNTCHKKGIAVVLDVVYNHLGPEGNYLQQFGPYFTSKYSTPWGDAVNFDDEWCDGVRLYFIENALMWFRDFHVDALRLDAVHAIKDFNPTHILRQIRQATGRLTEATGREYYLIAEVDLNDNRFINPLEKQGYGMHAQWVDEFHHALRVTAGEEQKGYYADFNGITHLAKSYRDAYVYDGQFSTHRKRSFGIKADGNPGKQFVVFSQNHDQVGNRMFGERTSTLQSFEMQKLLAFAVMVSPFIPLLFMGEEWSEPNPFLFFVDYNDPQLANAVRAGRKNEFASFHVAGEPPDPLSEKTFDQSKLQWHLLDEEPHKTMFSYYRELIWLRKTNKVLNTLSRVHLDIEVNEKLQTLAIHRWNDPDYAVCLMNFSKEPQPASLPGYFGQWEKIFDTAAPEWAGPAASANMVAGLKTVQLHPESAVMYKNIAAILTKKENAGK